MEAGARRHLAGDTELRGGEGLLVPAGDAGPRALAGSRAPVAVSFGGSLQGLRREGAGAPQAGWVDEGRLLPQAEVALGVADVQPGAGSAGCSAGRCLAPKKAIRGGHRSAHHLLLGQRGRAARAGRESILTGGGEEGARGKHLALSWRRRVVRLRRVP